MNESPLRAPQLITGARMLYLVWIPEDPSAVAALVPKELSPEAQRSDPLFQQLIKYNRLRAATRSAAGAGETTLHLSGDQLVATTILAGAPVIRTTCTVKVGTGQGASGQLRYITRVSGQLVSGRYPFVMKSADQFHVDKLEFLDRSHPTYDLRPKTALEVTFGFYSPDITFCYPGGEGPLNAPPHGV